MNVRRSGATILGAGTASVITALVAWFSWPPLELALMVGVIDARMPIRVSAAVAVWLAASVSFDLALALLCLARFRFANIEWFGRGAALLLGVSRGLSATRNECDALLLGASVFAVLALGRLPGRTKLALRWRWLFIGGLIPVTVAFLVGAFTNRPGMSAISAMFTLVSCPWLSPMAAFSSLVLRSRVPDEQGLALKVD